MRWLYGITDSMDMSLSKLGDSEGQGSLACCSSWSQKESDTNEQLNNNRGLDGWVASVGSMDMNVSKLRETVKDREAWRASVHGVTES